jgi:hypothetical protein
MSDYPNENRRSVSSVKEGNSLLMLSFAAVFVLLCAVMGFALEVLDGEMGFVDLLMDEN